MKVFTTDKIRNVALLGHGGCGKTSLAEAIAFLSGSSDPVGNFGKSPRKVARRYKMMGYRHVSLKIFKGDRHELLNEKDRDEVMDCMARAFEKWL